MRAGRKILMLLSLIIIAHSTELNAQGREEVISLTIENQRLDTIFSKLSVQSGYKFSYNPLTIPIDTVISVNYTDKSIKAILDDLSSLGIDYQIMDDHIILRKGKNKDAPTEATRKSIYTISGYIRDSSTGEALIGATIWDRESGKGVMSNGYGFFSLSLTEGIYDLSSSYLGYSPEEQRINLINNINLNINLISSVSQLEEIVIFDYQADHSVSRPGISELDIRPSVIKNNPGFLGQSDVIRSMQSMPGIHFYSDGSTIFHVRGGARDQNMILIDEAPVYNPAHMLGLFSVFTPESLNSIKVYKGDMPAYFGGRLSSVIDVKLKEGNRNKLSFHGNTGPIATTINLEGPLFRKKTAFYISARQSHFKWLLSGQLPKLEALHFSDFNIKYNISINNKNRLFFSIYSGIDSFKNRENSQKSSGIGWKNLAGTLRWNHVFGERLFSNTSLIISDYSYNLYTSYEMNQRWNTGISHSALKSDFSFYPSPGNTYKAGIYLATNHYSPGNYYRGDDPSPLLRGVPPKHATENAIYCAFENAITHKLKLSYGLRLTVFSNIGPGTEYKYDDNYFPVDTSLYNSKKPYHSSPSLEPRISLAYNFLPGFSGKISYSHNAQFEYLITNSVSPFTSLEVWLPAGPNIRPTRSKQLAAGLSLITKNGSYSLDMEVYNKIMNNYISYVDHAYMIFNPHVEGELRYGTGRSYGFEALLRKNTGSLNGWLSYTFSRTVLTINDLNSERPFPSRYDRPHSFCAHLDYNIKPGWTVSANWTYSSGSPITTPTGFYYYKGYQVPFYDERNNDRLPDYHRLDISTGIRLNSETSRSKHSLKLSLYNAYGRLNPFSINFNKIIQDSGALVVPSEHSVPPNLQSSMMYVFGMVPSISYHFIF